MTTINLEKNKIIEATVIPNTKQETIETIGLDKYKIKITEKPIKDKANKQIIKLFKKKGYVVEILKGQKTSKKIIKIVDVK
jgi:uncharacterized protein (TIGR00251 family)